MLLRQAPRARTLREVTLGRTDPADPRLDAPTRLFHWAIVVLLGVSWLAASQGWMTIHFASGYCVIALLLFRFAWGFIGSETSRFARFLKSPMAVLRHLAHLHHREPDTEIGHNAAGGWMVLLMLVLLVLQVGTGPAPMMMAQRRGRYSTMSVRPGATGFRASMG